VLAHLIGEEMSQVEMMTLLKLHRGQYSLVGGVQAGGGTVWRSKI
jgi:hypothetical protein